MVIEIFHLSNELDILDLRLHEHDSVVDKYILVEHPFEYQYRPKRMCYNENKERFKEFHHKIIHVIDDGPFNRNNVGLNLLWEQANSPRVKNVINTFKDDDFILITDSDVCLKREAFNSLDFSKCVHFKMKWYERYFDRITLNPDKITEMIYGWVCGAPVWIVKKYGVKDFSDMIIGAKPKNEDFNDIQIVEDSGYHFSKCGTIDEIIEHIKGHPHLELSTNPDVWNKEKLQHRFDMNKKWDDLTPDGERGMFNFKTVRYDPKNYPQYLNDHPEIYSKYFQEGMV